MVANGGLDLTLLGLGANGHLGLNEPGSTPDSPTRIVDLHTTTFATPPSTARGSTTVGGDPRYGAAAGVPRDLAAGHRGAKAEILHRALTGPVGPDVPASYLQNHPDTTVLADQAAAAAFG